MECLPHGRTPCLDCLIAQVPRRVRHHVPDRHRAAFVGQSKHRPYPLAACHFHVNTLHLFARVPSLTMQIQTDEGKGNNNRLGVLIGMLERPGIHDVLRRYFPDEP